jgi:hypothetical protein
VEADDTEPQSRADHDPPGVRRRRGLILLRCAHDIRAIFEERTAEAVPVRRDTPLAIGMPAGSNVPQVIELAPAVFDLIAALDDWTDPAELAEIAELPELIGELVRHGVLEARG